MTNTISPKAHIDPSAKIGQNVTIYPFAYIEADVVIGDGCTIYPFASIMAGTRLGRNNTVYQGSVLGAVPQDFEYKGAATTLVIGDHNTIRENVVINRATFADGETTIGNENFIMEGVHISHDVKIGNYCVIGYGTKIGGSCLIDDHAILSSNVIANPGLRIGRNAMVQSSSHFSHDVPPFIIASGSPVGYSGVNSTILSNAGISDKTQRHIAQAYRLVFNGKVNIFDAIHQVKDQVAPGPEIDVIIDFLQTTQVGIIGKV